jgi:hypothetical protein
MKFDPKLVDVAILFGGVRTNKIVLEPTPPKMKMVEAPLVSNEVIVTPFEGIHWVIACPRDSTLENLTDKQVYLCSRMLLKKAISIKEASNPSMASTENQPRFAGYQMHRRC